MRKYYWIGLLALILGGIGCSQVNQNALMNPPQCPVENHVIAIHDTLWHDDYFWLRDRTNPRVMQYLQDENTYTEQVTASWKPLQDTLYQEMIGRLEEERVSLPVKRDSFYYYWRYQKGQSYDIYCRKLHSMEAQEEIILDLNQLAQGHDFFAIGLARISPQHDLLAYSVDTQGSEEYTLYFKNLNNGKLLPDSMVCVSDLEWATDNQTVFYVCEDSIGRSYQAYRHQLGNVVDDDSLLYQEDDSSFYVWLSQNKTREYIFLGTADKTTSEQYWLRSDDPCGQFELIRPRQEGVEYYCYPHQDQFFILTNWNAPNYKVMLTSQTQLASEYWHDFIPLRDSVTVHDLDVFQDYVVLSEQWNGLPHLAIHHLETGTRHYLPVQEETYNLWEEYNPDFGSSWLRFGYESFTQPYAIYEYNMETGEQNLLKETKVMGDYDADLYRAERIWATASDGTAIPISLVYRKDQRKNSGNPCLLYGYGAYGDDTYPWFSSSQLSLLDRGWIFAIAHVRGGGEMGKQWHEMGKLEHKMNSFTDFIACAEHLIQAGYTDADRLAAKGGSAGGLLVGAVANLRPDLFQAIVAEVPFVDALNTMLDASLPLTVYEYKEWGNPNDKTFFDIIRAYSPYDNVSAQAYPNLLIEGSLNDSRVGYWEPAKWAAKLRRFKTDSNLLLLNITLDGGHGGGSGRYRFFEDLAFQYAFLLHTFEKK